MANVQMGNEINGHAERIYLHASEYKTYPPLSQDNIRISSDYGNIVLKGIGALPSVIHVHGWEKRSGKWKYMQINGFYVSNDWILCNGQWYYFDENEFMVLGWLDENGKRYYLRGSGAMAYSAWQQIEGLWYYFKLAGDMATDTWIPSSSSDKKYYVDENGVWDENKVLNESDPLRDKIIAAAEWYLNGCDSNVHAKYSMPKRGQKPDGKINSTLQPWQAYSYLDCSAYIGVVYTSAGIENFSGNGSGYTINTTTLRSSERTYKITKDKLLPGDLVFQNGGGTGGANHVGIFLCFNANNQIVAYDCASSVNGIRKRERPEVWETGAPLICA